ncbi:MAG: phage virion morphogenesis protein [Pseudomonadales bacterium]|nr:phage virion morphogenesis protein [Pseudomonadales bacterium]
MTGATLNIDIDYDDTQVRKALLQLLNASVNLEPAFRQIGELLDLQHRERWDSAVAPDGTPWEPLADSTLKRKEKRGRPSDILVDSGNLRDLLRWQASPDAVQFGTDRVYGAVHQFGRGQLSSIRTRKTLPAIPARPWLGIAESDKPLIVDILARHIGEQVRIK